MTSAIDRALRFFEHQGNRRLRPLGTWFYRRRQGRIGPRERNVILLTTRGRRTGKPHTVLLQAFPDGDDLMLVAANAGRATDPDWYRNLLAAGEATVELRGDTMRVRPEPVPSDTASALWPRILEKAPTYARYRRTAGREIPLVRLVVLEAGETDRALPR
jgi:deazaflavin-dependent oxidoreductase (nitroreductase family)